jgi:DNA polymerase III sliding clamp (beta) subunit (PCNA family)
MIINKTDLLKALETVKPGLSSKETTIEQSTSFAFMGNKIVTYNDEISISHTVEGLDIIGAVNANELYNLLGKLKKEEIEITVNNGEDAELHIKCGKAKASFVLQSEIKLPIDDIGEKGKWKSVPEGLLFAMEFAGKAAARDSSQGILTSVHVNTEGYVEATDNFRIIKVDLSEPLPIGTFIIPVKSIATVCKLKPVKVAEGKGWIHFKTEDNTTISCRILSDDSFPDTTAYLKVKGEELIFPESTLEMLTRAMVFCNKDVSLGDDINITIGEGRFNVKSQSASGKFEEDARVRYAGETINFSIAPYLLKDILSETHICTVGADRLKFSGDNWIYVTVLRSKQPEEKAKKETKKKAPVEEFPEEDNDLPF